MEVSNQQTMQQPTELAGQASNDAVTTQVQPSNQVE